MLSLEGKRVLVVGGSSGIGLGAAKLIAEAGARLTIASRSADKLAAAKDSLHGDVETQTLDGTDDDAVRTFFAETGTWDHVIGCAGAGGRGRIDEIDMATAQNAMNEKFWLYFRLARFGHFAPDGSLTLVSGEIAHKPVPGGSVISAVNAAIEGLTRGIAVDLAPVRVNTVCPGIIDTPMWDRMGEDAKQKMYAATAEALPVKRIGTAEDVGQAIVYLMTNPFSTGTVVMLEGGSLLR